MILFSPVDKLTALTKWPVLPFTCNFSIMNVISSTAETLSFPMI